ncbi:MAG: tRNA glutamyl-Q(34) synthetase GluQRS [Myxococcota bacterium]
MPNDLESVLRAQPARSPYIGRLAPSPTGVMHLGIAQTSLLAWLDARAHEGELRLRFEDVDTPRVVAGSADDLLRDLEWLGLTWEGPVVFQSDREARYAAALDRLRSRGLVYPCTCSRREIREASAPHAGDEGPRYPGTCRKGAIAKPGRQPSLRLRTRSVPVLHTDRRLGQIGHDVERTVGDFVLKRADGLWAYQMAVSVDDLDQGITCVVRGEDLAGSTARQLYLRHLLDADAPPLETLHAPLVRDEQGRRLAKRHGGATAKPLRDRGTEAPVLIAAMALGLGLIDRADPVEASDLVPLWRDRLGSAAHGEEVAGTP